MENFEKVTLTSTYLYCGTLIFIKKKKLINAKILIQNLYIPKDFKQYANHFYFRC